MVCIINRARGACRHTPGDEVLPALHRRLQREEGHRGDPAEEVPRAHQRADGGEVAAAPRRLLQRTQPSTRVPSQVQVWKMFSVTVKFRETTSLNLFMHLETICTVRTKGENLGYSLVSDDQ